MHERISRMLEQKYPGVRFRFSILPGQTGVDVKVLSGNPGFKYAEIKPRNPAQERRFKSQTENWGFKPGEVTPITYDANGKLYLGL